MDIVKWVRSPSCGGVSMDDLRNIAIEKLGINPDGMKKLEICQLIQAYYSALNQFGAGAKEDRLWKTYGPQLLEKFKTDRTATQWRNAKALPDDLIAAGKGKYLEWIILSYLRGGIKLFEDIPSKVPEALSDWIYLKDKKLLKMDLSGQKPWLDETNILNYCGLDKCTVLKKDKKEYLMVGLYDVLKQHQDVLDGRISTKEKKVGLGPADAELVYEDTQIRIFHPKTKEGACYYGQGTKWCTAATKAKNMFEAYNREGPLYVIIPKTPERVGQKYQIHIPTKSFKDEFDYDIKLNALIKKYPGLNGFKPIAEYLAFNKLLNIRTPLTIQLIEKFLAAGYDINYSVAGELNEDIMMYEGRNSLLSEAISEVNKDYSVVKYLLDHGVDANLGLDAALEVIDYRERLQVLLPYIKKARIELMSTLDKLIRDENLDVLDLLIEKGLDVNVALMSQDGSIDYPLTDSYKNKGIMDSDLEEKFKKLLIRGYDPNLGGPTWSLIYDVLDDTAEGGDEHHNTLLRLLIQYGADIYANDEKNNRTPLSYAEDIGLKDLFLDAYASRIVK
jgi:hypothetical protein